MKQHQELLHTNTTETNLDKKNRLTSLHRLTAIGALSAVALTGCAPGNVGAAPNPSETTQTQVEEEPIPTPAATAEAYGGIEPGLEGEALTAAFEIPAGLSDEELAQAFIDRINAWMMYGATPERAADFFNDTTKGADDFEAEYRQFAEGIESSIVDALFTEEMRAEGTERSLLDHMRDINVHSNMLYVRTISVPGVETDPEDVAPYYRWREIESIENVTPTNAEPGTRNFIITYLEKANVDLNRADDLGASSTPEGIEAVYQMSFVSDGENERVSGVWNYTLQTAPSGE